MDRQWYLSRDGRVFGPVTDAQLAASAAAGRVLPTDQLNIAGQPTWYTASTVPGLFPAPAPIPTHALEPEAVMADLETVVDEVEPVVADLEVLSLDDDPEPVPAPAVVATRALRMTCFACFNEVTLAITPGAMTAPCPRCGAAIETGEAAADAPPASANQAAFAKLESPQEFRERMQKKVAEAEAAAARDGAILGGVLGAVIPG